MAQEDLDMAHLNHMDGSEEKLIEPSDASPCNLMVKYLPERIDSDEALRALFAPFGEILKCKLIVDKNTGQSKGYGFVKFVDEESATEATEKMNGANLDSKIIRVGVANPLATSGKQEANIYVAGIPQTWSKHDLSNLFSPYGTITDCRILAGDKVSGQSRGVGFVRFGSYKDATTAIKSTDGTIPDGCTQALSVKFAKIKTKSLKGLKGSNTLMRPSPYGMYGQNNMGMQQYDVPNGFNNFPGQFQQPIQQQPFQNFNSNPNNSMPFSPSNMQNAFRNKSGGSEVGGLFVFHLPNTMDEIQLYQLFAPFGNIVQCKIVRDPHTQLSKGYGFVNYELVQQAQAAINALNSFPIGGKKLKVSFKQQKSK